MMKFLALCLAVAAFAGFAQGRALAAGVTAAQATDASVLTGGAYCRSTGGRVQLRTPTYGTNGNNPLPLNYPQRFCVYESARVDGFRSYDWVSLATLVSTKPTLAALAYYSQTPFKSAGCNGGPGSCYCAQLGGTDAFGGITAAGGGWVLDSDPTDVLDACVFPDLSIIDSYALFYHSAGDIRGQDLNGRLEYPNPN
jgi:putative hemolysin